MANLYVKYNGLVFGPLDDPNGECGGSCWPTPYVSRTDRFEHVGGKAHKVVDISIAGKVYEYDEFDNQSYGVIDTRRNQILSAFNEDFHTLYAGNYTFKHVKVNEVTFDSGAVGVLGFNVTLTSYEEWFDNAGIAEPKNEFSYSEGEDGVLTLRHSVSARAVRTDNEWIDNWDGGAGIDENDPVARARAWCIGGLCSGGTAATSWGYNSCANSFPLSAQNSWTDFSFYHATLNPNGFSPFSTSMNYNRITGTFSIEETWKQGKYSEQGYVEHYDISEKYSPANDDYTTIQISYSIKGNPYTSDATMRATVPTVGEFYAKLFDATLNAGGVLPVGSEYPYGLISADLLNVGYTNGMFDPEPVSYEVKENKNESSISVTIAFNQLDRAGLVADVGNLAVSITGGGVHNPTWLSIQPLGFNCSFTNYYWHAGSQGYAFLEWNVSVSEDTVTEITTVDVTVTMKSKGTLAVRKARVEAWFNSINDGDGLPSSFLSCLANWEYNAVAPDGLDGRSLLLFPQSAHFPLRPWHDTLSVDKGPGQITISASFSNQDLYYESMPSILDAGPSTIQVGHFHWDDLTFDVSQKCAINVLSLKGGQNGNAIFPDYLVYDHNTLSKETTTITAKGTELIDYLGHPYEVDTRRVTSKPAVADVALGMLINRLQDSPLRGGFIQIPLNNNWSFRGLESHDITKNRHGVFSQGIQLGAHTSKSLSVSQTIDGNFLWNGEQGILLGQDGFGVLGIYDADGNYIGERP